MAWITPVTDRLGSLPPTTAADLNRIAGNVEVLGGAPIRTDYTDADIVKTDEWAVIVEFTQQFDPLIDDSTRWDNLNRIEAALLNKHENGFILGQSLLGSGTL